MDPYAQLIVYYFGELNNWNADSMYFNIYHGSNMFKNKVWNTYHDKTCLKTKYGTDIIAQTY